MNIFDTTGSIIQYSLEAIIFNILLSLVLALLISWVYMKTHRGLSYSQSFTFALVLLPIITTVIMMVIGNSLAAAFALLGAFTIIRFRTPVKETKDMAYLFLALVIGMAVGTGNATIAIASTILILIIIYVLSRVHFGALHKLDYMLNFYVNAGETEQYQGVFDKYLKNHALLHMNSHQQGAILELVFSIKFVDQDDAKKFISELHEQSGITNVRLVSSESDVEY